MVELPNIEKTKKSIRFEASNRTPTDLVILKYCKSESPGSARSGPRGNTGEIVAPGDKQISTRCHFLLLSHAVEVSEKLRAFLASSPAAHTLVSVDDPASALDTNP